MTTEPKISRAVIRRLPKYYRYLGEVYDSGVKRISSKELSKIMNITASQIRQDLNNFGSFGLQGYGYNIELLYAEIGRILGLDKSHKLVVIGCGHIGQAIMNYQSFSSRGFVFTAAFDNDPNIIGTKINGVEVLDVKDLEKYLSENEVDIVCLTLPKCDFKDIINIINNSSVTGVWNFTNMEINFREGIQTENVHLMDSLMTLSYRIDEDDIIKRYNGTARG